MNTNNLNPLFGDIIKRHSKSYDFNKTHFVWDVINLLKLRKELDQDTRYAHIAKSIYDELIRPFSCYDELIDFIKKESGVDNFDIKIIE